MLKSKACTVFGLLMLQIHLLDDFPIGFCPSHSLQTKTKRTKTRDSPCNVMPSISIVRLPGLHHRQGVPNPKLALEVQGGAHSCQPPLHHDGNPVAQHIGLLHAVGCQHNCPVPPVLLDHIPCKSGHTHKPKVSPQSAARCQARKSSGKRCSPTALLFKCKHSHY